MPVSPALGAYNPASSPQAPTPASRTTHDARSLGLDRVARSSGACDIARCPRRGAPPGDDRHALRASLARATRSEDLIVADGLRVGRVLPWGSVALYRPDPAAPLRHRLLELDPQGRSRSCSTARSGVELRAAWVSLADGSAVGVLPGGAQHPLWGRVGPPRPHGAGPRSRHADPGGRRRLARRRSHPPRRRARPAARRRRRRVAECPRGAGARPGTARAPVSRAVPDRTALLEPHRVVSLRRGRGRPRAVRGGRRGSVRARRVRGSGGRLAACAPRAAHPAGWARRPAPGRRRTRGLAGPRLPPARIPTTSTIPSAT